jgi:hypothetical protein
MMDKPTGLVGRKGESGYVGRVRAKDGTYVHLGQSEVEFDIRHAGNGVIGGGREGGWAVKGSLGSTREKFRK